MNPEKNTPRLTIKRQNGDYREIEWHADAAAITIGRDVSNDIIIDHVLASRKHARLQRDESGYVIVDLHSTNGTFVNDEMVDETCQIHHQDKIIVADTIITFHDSDATARGPLPLDVLRVVQEELRVDSQTKSVLIKGKIILPPLTVKEFQLLELLYQHKGHVVSKDAIAQTVWDYEVYDYNAIDALIYRVRQRIETDPSHPVYLLTQRGFGYRLETTPE